MQLRLSAQKPKLLEGPALCDFRTSKAYLWGLVRDRLAELQASHGDPLLVLDAACHALITRSMFPKGCRYHGLDVARERLQQAMARRLPNDRLYLADLTRPLPLHQAFDAVVSLNTFSHLPALDQPQATSNLVQACRIGGDLLINTNIDGQLMPLVATLLKAFAVVEPIYFASFRSKSEEEAGLVNAGNVLEKIGPNEASLPNDACLHRQVLLHARHRQGNPDPQQPPTAEQPADILQLNQVPKISRCDYADDQALLDDSHLWSSRPLVTMTAALANAPSGRKLRHQLEERGLSCCVLDADLEVDHFTQLVVLGLETEWSPDTGDERLAINRLRRKDGLSITFALVAARDGLRCKPSLVANDL